MILQIGVALWSVLAIVKADYIIDDRDNRVGYSSGYWASVTELGNLAIGSSQAYDLTATYAVCATQNDCHMTINFHGSGIEIYAINMESNMNATFMVDGSFNASTFTQVAMPVMYNVSTFSIAGLDSSVPHTVMANLNTYLPDGPLPSGFIFDFAIVTNGSSTIPSATEAMPTMSMSMSPSATGSSSMSQSRSMIGAIAGGAVGGTLVLAALIGFILCLHYRKRAQPPSLLDVDPEPKYFLSPEATTVNSYNFSPRSSQAAILDYAAPRLAPVPTAAPFQFTPLTASAIERARTPPPQPTQSRYPSEKHQPGISTALSRTGSTTSAPDPPVSLTDEQIDFIRGLGSANVPPDDIARVIARMKADYGDGRVAGSIPPGYE